VLYFTRNKVYIDKFQYCSKIQLSYFHIEKVSFREGNSRSFSEGNPRLLQNRKVQASIYIRRYTQRLSKHNTVTITPTHPRSLLCLKRDSPPYPIYLFEFQRNQTHTSE